ncbi:GTP-binding protein [Herbiconiux sp.]|uniref:GTP-binding protein n=1 Tax=Herbiconiux sp. TaxID=1871186 RepID=UPI0025BA45AD|nr:GTP-binding protein [Herbiconiux sp.]
MSAPTSPGLAVTLVSGSDAVANSVVARLLCGASPTDPPREIEAPDVDDAEFATGLADDLAEASRNGLTGTTAIVLEPGTDVVEVALVLEHVLGGQEPAVAVGIRDVVAVSSVREILALLFVTGSDPSAFRRGGDFDSPGRLARRLEFASLIVLTDTASAPPELGLVQSFLARLAPAARIVALENLGNARPRAAAVVVRGRAHRLGAAMGWQQQLATGTPATGRRAPIGAFVFRDPRPFHPERLHEAIQQHLTPDRVGRIARSRGFVRLASRPERVGSWSSAGDVVDIDPTLMLNWDPESPVGQEIAFFGLDLDGDALAAVLGDCLVRGEELVAGAGVWSRWADPFPEWTIHHH